jgi:hypothetical protein
LYVSLNIASFELLTLCYQHAGTATADVLPLTINAALSKPRSRARADMESDNAHITDRLLDIVANRDRALAVPHSAVPLVDNMPLQPLTAAHAPKDELLACLVAWQEQKQLDTDKLFDLYKAFAAHDYRPASFACALDARIMEIAGCTEGTALELKAFCIAWTNKRPRFA